MVTIKNHGRDPYGIDGPLMKTRVPILWRVRKAGLLDILRIESVLF